MILPYIVAAITGDDIPAPNLITPNGDGKNDKFIITVPGDIPIPIAVGEIWYKKLPERMARGEALIIAYPG